jgi:hypothetical protein
LPKVLLFSPIYLGQRAKHYIFPRNDPFLGASIVSRLFYDELMKLVHCKKVALVRHLQLINMKQNKYFMMVRTI